MAGVNKVILMGRLGADPEVRYTPNGQAVAQFSLATSRQWKDNTGQRQEKTDPSTKKIQTPPTKKICFQGVELSVGDHAA